MTSPSAAKDAPLQIEHIRAEYLRREREMRDFYGRELPVRHFLHLQNCRACIGTMLREHLLPLNGRHVVDIGCGSGAWLREFLLWGADPGNVAGIDMNSGQIDETRRILPRADLRTGDASRLPWPDGAFDLVTQFTVLTSVLQASVKRAIAAEMLRVLKPDGAILWYDFRFNNPRNPQVRGIPADEIRSLFPGCHIQLRRVTLAPPLARLVVPVSWILALCLEAVPFLKTHYLGIIRKRGSAG